jgi:hypothetical protein
MLRRIFSNPPQRGKFLISFRGSVLPPHLGCVGCPPHWNGCGLPPDVTKTGQEPICLLYAVGLRSHIGCPLPCPSGLVNRSAAAFLLVIMKGMREGSRIPSQVSCRSSSATTRAPTPWGMSAGRLGIDAPCVGMRRHRSAGLVAVEARMTCVHSGAVAHGAARAGKSPSGQHPSDDGGRPGGPA